MALPYSGVARPPAAVISIHQLKLVVLKSEEEIKQAQAEWRNIGTAMRDYGKQLAEEQFEEIKAAIAKL